MNDLVDESIQPDEGVKMAGLLDPTQKTGGSLFAKFFRT
jgi:hypothetical protein